MRGGQRPGQGQSGQLSGHVQPVDEMSDQGGGGTWINVRVTLHVQTVENPHTQNLVWETFQTSLGHQSHPSHRPRMSLSAAAFTRH